MNVNTPELALENEVLEVVIAQEPTAEALFHAVGVEVLDEPIPLKVQGEPQTAIA